MRSVLAVFSADGKQQCSAEADLEAGESFNSPTYAPKLGEKILQILDRSNS